jgi:TetR/AcrR family transcriptional regulator of autoinduction and epiphytic fitness
LEDQLDEFAQAKMKLLEDPAWMGLMKVGLGVFVRDPELAKRSMAQAEEGEVHLALWLQAGTEDRRLEVENPALAAQVFWAMISGALFWPQVIQGPMDPGIEELLRTELVKTFLARFRA